MLGKTHMAAGIAAGLMAVSPANPRDLVLGIGASALGALIPDIDVGTSHSHKDADIVTSVSALSVLFVIVLEWKFHLGIYKYLFRESNVARIVFGSLAFIGICAYGKEQPHRSFMHSFLAMFLLSGCLAVVFPAAVPYFAAGFLSHLALDMLNFKGEMLLYPSKKGFCLKLCRAHGYVNQMLFWAGSILAVGVAGYYLIGMFR